MKEADMNIIIDKADSRGHANHGWLNTSHTFSFADYYNPQRMHFGALRVLNDDTVIPRSGFDTHPHKNMEVVSIPLKGCLRHGDSLENSHIIEPGQIQVMSAGSGIYHSEYNASSDENLEFLQIWVIPDQTDTPPRYADYDIRPLLKHNEISTFIAPGTAIALRQQAWFSWAELDRGTTCTYRLKGKQTGVYIFVIEGSIAIDETEALLDRRDGAGITDIDALTVTARKPSTILLIEVAL
nr:pirin family protein [Akkermansia glycaniphila]